MLKENICKVSVVVATYRREQSLRNAIDSVMKQTYENIEVIIVNDNADISWNVIVNDIVGSYRLARFPIVYIENEINKGSANSRNIGIFAATGDYVTFLDDDDIYKPEKIQKQVSHMLQEQSKVSITNLELYSETGNLVEVRNRDYIKKTDKKSMLKYHYLYHLTGTDTLMFLREYLIHIGGFPLIDLGDEFYLMEKAIENGGRISYLNCCEVKAVIHSNEDGLSSGLKKIEGENALYERKKRYFDLFDSKERRYIRMRHFAVVSFAELRMKHYAQFMKYVVRSFFCAPLQFIMMGIVIVRKG